jgi:hypothetical protein
MRFGLMTRPPRSDEEAKPKKLTFFSNGLTNNAVVRLDKKDYIFGEKPFRRGDTRPGEDELVDNTPGKWAGSWRERDVPLGKGRIGKRSVWHYDKERVTVTQHVEVIVGQSGDHDTCLVQYTIENGDTVEHELGLRFLLDTFIGNNDGVPFLIPGQQSLINTRFGFGNTERVDDFEDLRRRKEWADEVPAFLQARETEDFKKPGTVAQLGLKVEGLEPPDRVTLGAYPDVQLNGRDPRCLQEKTMWVVPVLSIQSLRQKPDSCVTLYWTPRKVGPGQKRVVGFTYGLGYLASSKGEGKLALTSGGSYTPEGEITVTAYVLNPQPDMTVTLKLPEGFELAEGESATRPVPPAGAASKTSPVSWKVKAGLKTGQFTFEAETSTKLKESHPVIIRPRRLFGN